MLTLTDAHRLALRAGASLHTQNDLAELLFSVAHDAYLDGRDDGRNDSHAAGRRVGRTETLNPSTN